MSIKSKERVQSLGEVFTALSEVNLMLDMLGDDVKNPDKRILEPSCGTGNFLVEIVRRRSQQEDPLLAIKNVFGVDISAENVSETKDRILGVLKDTFPPDVISASIKSIEEKLCENFILGDFLELPNEWLLCDVIVGNPPYQEMDGGFNSSARPLYHKFVEKSLLLANKVCLIIPARWYAGGKGLDAFRKNTLANRSLMRITDWENSRDCFPSVDISGGICVLLFDKGHDGDCVIETRAGKEAVRAKTRDLRDVPVFIRSQIGYEIVRKVTRQGHPLSSKVFPRNPFGMATNFIPSGQGEVEVLTNKGWVNHPRNGIPKGKELIDGWKVFVSGTSFEHAGAAGKDGKRRVLSRVILAGPGTAATETYILVGNFKTKKEAESLCSYLKTRPVRYLIHQASSSHHITRDRFRFVPIAPWDTEWEDDCTVAFMGLNNKDKQAIESEIRIWSRDK